MHLHWPSLGAWITFVVCELVALLVIGIAGAFGIQDKENDIEGVILVVLCIIIGLALLFL